jgi:hypothetical protein
MAGNSEVHGHTPQKEEAGWLNSLIQHRISGEMAIGIP